MRIYDHEATQLKLFANSKNREDYVLKWISYLRYKLVVAFEIGPDNFSSKHKKQVAGAVHYEGA